MRRKNGATDEERGRWSSKKKMAAVLRLMKGEDLDALSRELKVNAATLSSWREVFLASGLAVRCSPRLVRPRGRVRLSGADDEEEAIYGRADHPGAEGV